MEKIIETKNVKFKRALWSGVNSNVSEASARGRANLKLLSRCCGCCHLFTVTVTATTMARCLNEKADLMVLNYARATVKQ